MLCYLGVEYRQIQYFLWSNGLFLIEKEYLKTDGSDFARFLAFLVCIVEFELI
jgi:hypothetical protein